MDFGWSDEQLDRRERAREFAERELSDASLEQREHDGIFDRDLWKRCARFGILGLAVPIEFGGEEVALPTAMLIMEGLGEGCADNGLPFALNAQLWTVQHPMVRFGSDEQKQRYLPGLCNGTTIGAHALTEPDSGSDAFSMSMRADRRGDDYVLEGTKCLVSLAPISDVILLFARTDVARGKW